jgi:hypothetical protein
MIRKSVKRFSDKIMPDQNVDRLWTRVGKTGPRDETVAARSLLAENP